MRNNRDNYVKWILAAEDDLKLAKVILKEENFYSAICFHSQQSIEKSLKAFLLYQNFSEDLRTHRLEDLVNLSTKYNKNFLNFLDDCKILDQYYIPTRYPDALIGTTSDGVYRLEEAEESIKIARKIYNFVKSKIL